MMWKGESHPQRVVGPASLRRGKGGRGERVSKNASTQARDNGK